MTIGVVTGAGSGMGRACVERLRSSVDVLVAVDLRGCSVPGVESVTADLRDAAAISAVGARVRDRGPLRFLVHAAGISPTMADPRTIVDVNLVSTARILDAFEPHVESDSVAVVFASSAGYLSEMLSIEQTVLLGGVRSPDFLEKVEQYITDSGLAYLFSKVGVQLEAQQAAVRWARLGGRVVSVSPGNIDTPMGRLELQNQPLMREAQERHPLQRLGRPAEVAAVVAFLVSEEASFVNGIDVLVDGAERAQALCDRHGR